jgi:hypothetical protein
LTPPRSTLLLAGAGVLALAVWRTPIVRAQSSIVPLGLSAPVYRETRGAPHFPQDNGFAAARPAFLQLHLNPIGKPCLEVFPVANAQAINSNIYDHDLLLNNQCSRTIRLSVCYYQTRSCSPFAIAGYTRQLKPLGISPEKNFRIEYREYVD